MKTLSALTLLALTTSAFAQSENREIYVHAFRAPSTGVEYRQGNWGFHGGIYTTVLDARDKSTEFLKFGSTFYYKWGKSKSFERFESYLSVAAMRGLNRDYDKKDAGFAESGFRYQLGKGFDVRFGTGLLVAKGFHPEVNPTVGISYSIPLR